MIVSKRNNPISEVEALALLILSKRDTSEYSDEEYVYEYVAIHERVKNALNNADAGLKDGTLDPYGQFIT